MSEQYGSQKQQTTGNDSREEEKFTLYSLLQVDSKCSTVELKKQYHRMVLVHHPDKNLGNPSAKDRFLRLKEAYNILSDPDKRKEYDETGQVGNKFDQQSFQSAYEYFRKQFKPISHEDILHFAKEYRFGSMEQEDLIDYYTRRAGDMTALLECIPLSSNEDVPRFLEFFELKIAQKHLPKYKAFMATKHHVRVLPEQSAEVEAEKQQELSSLIMAIHNKKHKNDFISSLEQKYGLAQNQKARKEENKKARKEQNQKARKEENQKSTERLARRLNNDKREKKEQEENGSS